MKKIYLTQGKYMLVDNSDYKLLDEYRWYYDGKYATRKYRNMDGKKVHVSAQNTIMFCPKGSVVYHKDGHALNNQKDNLHLMTRSEAMRLYRRNGVIPNIIK